MKLKDAIKIIEKSVTDEMEMFHHGQIAITVNYGQGAVQDVVVAPRRIYRLSSIELDTDKNSK
jgi:hypothetical protein